MNEATYLCSKCRKDHTMRFAASYKIFQRWLLTCPWCRRYGLQRLVGLKDGADKVVPLRRWDEVCR